jgi:hypothetical protein
MTPIPPRWAEALLRVFLRPGDVESVSGDLLEEYRDAIHPVRGQAAADAWYVMQVLGFVWRSVGLWAVLFAAAAITRNALDWLAPPLDFHARSTVSTFLGMGLLTGAGLWASIRFGVLVDGLADVGVRLVAGALAGIASAALAALISVAGAAVLLAIWHDPATMAAIRGSGGLDEVFVLPFVMILPGCVLGTIGGMLGAVITRLRSV